MVFLPLALGALLQAQNSLSAVNPLPQAPPQDKVLAKVNGKPIKASDIESLLWDWRGEEVLQDVVSLQLAEQAARKEGLTVTDAEVMQSFNTQLEQFKRQLPAGKSVEQALRDQGFPRSRLLLRVRTELLVDKLALKEFRPADYVKISTLIFKPESEQAVALAKAIEKADASYAKLEAGAAWEKVLADSGAEQRIVSTKGLVGWRNLSIFPASVAKDLEGLKPGQYSKPAQTTNGIQIFRLESKGSEAAGKDLEDLKNYCLTTARPAMLSKIRSEAKVEKFFP